MVGNALVGDDVGDIGVVLKYRISSPRVFRVEDEEELFALLVRLLNKLPLVFGAMIL